MTVHVIGAGLAGLAAAVALAAGGEGVVLHEAAPLAGGRCRSWEDRALGCRIDNGNHLMMSANHAVRALVRLTGAEGGLAGPERARFPLFDAADGARWVLAPGRLPSWLADPRRRVPQTRLIDYLSALGIALAGGGATVAELIPPSHPLWRRFWEPLVLAVMNAPAGEAAAAPLGRVLRETFLKGEAWCRPLIAAEGLDAALVAPALGFLARRGVPVRFGARLKALRREPTRVAALEFGDATIDLGAADRVILAVPSWVAGELLPELEPPPAGQAIVNAHYRLAERAFPARPDLVGLVGAPAHWAFTRADLVSVTVSAADALVERPAEALAALLWPDVARALRLDPARLPAWRIVKERRATFRQTPADQRRRPGPRTRWRNLFLAGDWTATGLPATIEGAVRSGHSAAGFARR